MYSIKIYYLINSLIFVALIIVYLVRLSGTQEKQQVQDIAEGSKHHRMVVLSLVRQSMLLMTKIDFVFVIIFYRLNIIEELG